MIINCTRRSPERKSPTRVHCQAWIKASGRCAAIRTTSARSHFGKASSYSAWTRWKRETWTPSSVSSSTCSDRSLSLRSSTSARCLSWRRGNSNEEPSSTETTCDAFHISFCLSTTASLDSSSCGRVWRTRATQKDGEELTEKIFQKHNN